MRFVAHALLDALKRLPPAVRVLWLLAAIALPIWAHYDDTAWDLKVYDHALVSLHNGHDPYRDATDIQKQHHQQRIATGTVTNDATPPYSYVYAPVTLPLLKALGTLPRTLLLVLYWTTYALCALATVAVFSTFAETSEYPGIFYLAGVAVFFPGLLANGVILSGNIAYLLYGAVAAAALLGWRRNRWLLFYAAVLAATCVKAPLLSLVLIAPLSARRQWKPAVTTIALGLGIYALQPLFAPLLFRHYLEAVELQFSFNHDFGCSPAGLFSNLLYQHGYTYSPGCYIVYAAYAIPVAAALLHGARLFHQSRITLRQWAPVLLVGILLLNPRIMEYDAAPVTIPMALILWRTARTYRARAAVYTLLAVAFLVLNAVSVDSWLMRKALDGPLILLTFIAGMHLIRTAASTKDSSTGRNRYTRELAAA